jgi:hypothetical protein
MSLFRCEIGAEHLKATRQQQTFFKVITEKVMTRFCVICRAYKQVGMCLCPPAPARLPAATPSLTLQNTSDLTHLFLPGIGEI